MALLRRLPNLAALQNFVAVTAAGLLVAMAVWAAPANAKSPDPFNAFASDSYSATEQAVERLVKSGDERAASVLQALLDGRLYYDAEGDVFIKTDGALERIEGALPRKESALQHNEGAPERIDGALPRKESAPERKESALPRNEGAQDGLQAVRINNRLRRAIENALGSLSMTDKNPAKRIESAQNLFKSRDAGSLAALEDALRKENNADVAKTMNEARAAILATLPQASQADKIVAITVLRARGDRDALSLLNMLADSPDPLVRANAQSGAKAVQQKLDFWAIVQNAWYGLSLGSVLLLAAIGLAITFGVMGVINMAHGEMVMIGAYTTFAVQEILRSRYPEWFDYSLLISVPLAFLVSGAVGVLIERSIIKFLYGRPLETLLATFGVSLILQQSVRTIFGPNNREVGAPSFMAGAFELGGLSITYGRLWIIVFSLLVFCGLLAVLKLTPFGLRMRAVTQNRRMAASMGVSTSAIDALAFGLGSGVAGIAGVALSQIDNVSPNLGQSYIIDSFMVVVFGGVGSLWGALVAALTLGVANKFLEPFAGAVLAKIFMLIFIILFIQKRPRGLFAQKGRAAES